MATSKQWLKVGIGIKRWIFALALGLLTTAVSFAFVVVSLLDWAFATGHTQWLVAILLMLGGLAITIVAVYRLIAILLAPYRQQTRGDVIDLAIDHSTRTRGLKVVAIGGGTGLPATLRGLKPYTSNITAVVTVADDGGSSGRLRRDLQVLPPGDLRNNIVALADDESLLARLFQYRFPTGELEGHSFGNLFIAALSNVVSNEQPHSNPLADALVEVQRVLNIRGRVLPATLTDIRLIADLRLKNSERTVTVIGESKIESVDGYVASVRLEPATATAYAPVIDAILEADLIVIGPGSLYTSIIPNLLVAGVADAIRASKAVKVYVCNVATQPVETEGYSVADHVIALEKHVGRGVFQSVLANNAMPTENVGKNTRFVTPIPDNHEIQQRYEVRYTDLTDAEKPWRHDPKKLGAALLELVGSS